MHTPHRIAARRSASLSTSIMGASLTEPSLIDASVMMDGARLGRRAPLQLFARGDPSLLDRPMITIVGTRSPSVDGLSYASTIAERLARAGFVIVSGLALGVDVAAHRAAIASGGRTIAVIGTPLDRAYPAAHAALQAQIARDHLVLTPFAPGSTVSRGNFPRRDRVMAALGDAIIVIEALDGSGTLYTAREARRLDRPLLVAPPVIAARPAWLAAWRDADPIDRPRIHVLTCAEDAATFAVENLARARKGLLSARGSH